MSVFNNTITSTSASTTIIPCSRNVTSFTGTITSTSALSGNVYYSFPSWHNKGLFNTSKSKLSIETVFKSISDFMSGPYSNLLGVDKSLLVSTDALSSVEYNTLLSTIDTPNMQAILVQSDPYVDCKTSTALVSFDYSNGLLEFCSYSEDTSKVSGAITCNFTYSIFNNKEKWYTDMQYNPDLCKLEVKTNKIVSKKSFNGLLPVISCEDLKNIPWIINPLQIQNNDWSCLVFDKTTLTPVQRNFDSKKYNYAYIKLKDISDASLYELSDKLNKLSQYATREGLISLLEEYTVPETNCSLFIDHISNEIATGLSIKNIASTISRSYSNCISNTLLY